jgi:serine protease inhibitor ecotin
MSSNNLRNNELEFTPTFGTQHSKNSNYTFIHVEDPMRVYVHAILTVALWLTVFALFAQQPHLEITLADSLAIPYSYDRVIQLPNGNLQFYKLNYGTSSIQFNGFQYLSQTNEITALEDIGTVTNLNGLYPIRSYTIVRFGNFYLVHKLVSGLAVFKLDQNTLESRSINEFSFDQYFSFNRMTEIVSEEAMVIALADSLVYYNFVEGSSQTLLQGAEYQCTTQVPIVLYLPDSLFVYIKDTFSASPGPEDWIMFDLEGNYLFTHISTNPNVILNYVVKSSGSEARIIQGRWYIPVAAPDNRICTYECTFSEPDSLHFYNVGAPGSYNESALSFSPFSYDRILRLYYDDSFESVFMYCNYVPLEQFPQVIFTFNWGYSYPVLRAISEDITTMTVRLPDQIAILALWTYDFPSVHEFYFPTFSNAQMGGYVFANNDSLRIITNQKVYSFQVGISTALADETMEHMDQVIQVYPNPVRSSQQLTIKTQSNEQFTLDIYNIKGQKVQSLQMDKSGQIEWNLRGHENNSLPSGVYIIKSRNSNAIKPCKVVFIN